ncbi:conjugal transfer protein, partial [Streptomyces sp. H28]|nr:conjugal transfer protein [Streptomyces sp. H28]
PRPKVRGAVSAESTPPRRATGRLPEVARSPRPKRTWDQLLTEARAATAGLPDAKVTGEGIRRAVRTSPANARKLRDTLLTERTTAEAA